MTLRALAADCCVNNTRLFCAPLELQLPFGRPRVVFVHGTGGRDTMGQGSVGVGRWRSFGAR